MRDVLFCVLETNKNLFKRVPPPPVFLHPLGDKASSLPLILAEASACSGGGAAGISDRFAISFWFADTLGSMARPARTLFASPSVQRALLIPQDHPGSRYRYSKRT